MAAACPFKNRGGALSVSARRAFPLAAAPRGARPLYNGVYQHLLKGAAVRLNHTAASGASRPCAPASAGSVVPLAKAQIYQQSPTAHWFISLSVTLTAPRRAALWLAGRAAPQLSARLLTAAGQPASE